MTGKQTLSRTVIVCDKFDAEGVARLKAQPGLNVLYEGGYKRDALLALLPQAHGLIIRSATTVDKEILEKAPQLELVIRAGVGVDNIDIQEASRRGVIVMNAPGGNSVSTAEQALALLFATARHTPQANASMKEGAWEKSKFKGVELTGKTLGVVGLGRIGKEVVKRARGIGMNVIGFDPYIPSENLAHLEIDLVTREDLIRQADFITVHTPLTEATMDFINKDNLSDLKDGVRLINAARGGIYNEEALAIGLESGKIKAVALDVFTSEPPPGDFPLKKFENCIMTPHLGASTGDAEFAVAMESVDELIDFFDRGIARNALNFPTIDPDSMDYLKPYFSGGQGIGKLLASMCPDFRTIEFHYRGDIAGYMVQPVTTSILFGALTVSMGDEVNLVNAPMIARDRGIQVVEDKDTKAEGFSSYVHVIFKNKAGEKAELRYTAINRTPLVFSLSNLPLEFRPEGVLLILKNHDRPRVVGNVGNFLADHDVNIADMELGRAEKGGMAHCVITVDQLLPPDVLTRLQQQENITYAVQVDLR